MDMQSKAKKLIEMIQTTSVEWKPLGEVAELKRGKTITAKVAIDGGIPVISGGQQPAYYHNEANRTGETITVAGSGAYAGFIMYWDEPIFVSDAFSIKPNIEVLNTRYTYHFLLQNQGKIYNLKKGSGVPHVYPKDLALLTIPILPLETQQKIVKILDKFTELEATLEATLEAELALRKHQYRYYRDFLLDFDNQIGGWIADGYKGRLKDVVWKTLGEVALDFGRGKSKHRPRNDVRLYGGSIPFIQTGDIKNAGHIIESYTQTYNDFGLKQSKLWKKGTLCITIAANIAETAVLGFDACFPDSVIGFVANPKETTSDYVEYLLSSLKMKLQEKGMGSAQENINLTTFSNMRFPFPPLPEQEKIVAILDKFDTLTHSISEGLPHEIALRRKQYEYYREQLLAFPKAA